jgi:SAM-dependent methyltransferase
MLFRLASDMTPTVERFLDHYDRLVKKRLPADYPYPIRLRHWELYHVLSRVPPGNRNLKILDTGSYSTYTAFYLDCLSDYVTVSDSFGWAGRSEYLALPDIPPPETWLRAIAVGAPNVGIAKFDLEHIPLADESFDVITCISTIEHCRNPHRALAEMMRCLRPGGRLLLTTDHHEPGIPFDGFDRYLSREELAELFGPYRDISPERSPDYAAENWSYPPHEGIVLVFVELRKTQRSRWKRIFANAAAPARGVDFQGSRR